jgi:hypothetical protein
MRDGTSFLTRVLLLLATLRLLWLFASEPMLAVANNYDMIRVQACIEAYPDRDAAIPPETNSYDRPLERYRFVPNVGAPCFLTSEALFAYLAYPAMWAEHTLRADGSFSVRWDGAVKLCLLLGVAWAAHRALCRLRERALALGHALLFALVVADPGVGLYLNGFYAEFAAVFYFYALLAALLIGLIDGASGWRLLAGIVLAAVGLALAKVQHVVTPMFVLGVLVSLRIAGRRIDARVLAALAAGTLLGATIQGLHLASEQTRSMGRANIVNTVFYALLPNADDPERFVEKLGLPSACAAHSGKNWFTPGMAEGELCPAAMELSRPALTMALASEPALVLRTLWSGVPRSRPWIPSYLGLVEGEAMGRLPASHPTLDRVYVALPSWLHLILMAGVPCVATLLIWRRRERSQQAANAVLAVLASYPWFSLAVVVLGDGYADTAKQSHLGHAALLAAIALSAMLMVRALRRTASVAQG